MSSRILIVDDNPLVQDLTQLILQQQEDFLVDSAWHGAEAVRACAEEQYDVVLMDCQMPIMDGPEATRCIRKLGTRQPVIIGISGHAIKTCKEQCLAAGMDDFLTKPYTSEQLLAAVANGLEVAARRCAA